MNWKKYKALSKKEKTSEAYYIVGMDIGNDSTTLAIFNFFEDEPEVIDLSGGYGRPSIPTVIQYIIDTKEWVFGEYAILNRSMYREVTVTNLLSRLGYSEYVDIDKKPYSIVALTAMFIREVLSNIKNINPNAEIAGIIAVAPSYFSESALNELEQAFKKAGYESELIKISTDRECIFTGRFRNEPPLLGSKTMLLDYGASGLRGGVYCALNEEKKSEISCLTSLLSDESGTAQIDRDILELYVKFYSEKNSEPDKSVIEQLKTFVYQTKSNLFHIRQKPVKLYFNFAFPPFFATVSAEEADDIIAPHRWQFVSFIDKVLEMNAQNLLKKSDVDEAICVGGGFEAQWARETVRSLFPKAKILIIKNSNAETALGAATLAAILLGVADGEIYEIQDRHQLTEDIGVYTKTGVFATLAERNSFWWQTRPPRYFILDEADFSFELHARDANSESRLLATRPLEGLPKRLTRLKAEIKFISEAEGEALISDLGFGDIFPNSGYVEKISFSLEDLKD